MLNRSSVARLLLPLVFITACGSADSPEPSAPPTIVGSDEPSATDPAQVDAPADDTIDSGTGDTDDSEEGDDETVPDTDGAATDEPSQTTTDERTDSPSADADAETDSTGDSNDDGAGSASGVDLEAVLPSPDSIEGTSTSGYNSIEELIADRAERPPFLRCGASDDPTSIAIATQAQAVGRSFDYDDGLRTTTVQLWAYPDTATAERAIALIDALRCDAQAIGPITIDGLEYGQFDSATVGTPAFDREGVDEAIAANFERRLSSTTDLVVEEDLQFARVGTVVVFAGAREIRTPDIDAELPREDAIRVGRGAIAALLGTTGSGLVSSPATLTIGSSEAGTYRSSTTGFCLVRIDNADGSTIQVSWGSGEQALWTAAEGQTVEFGEGCGTWGPIDPATTTSTLPAGATGTLIVGTDIPAGPLVVTSVGDCSIDQLTGFSGSASDLISSTILAPGDSIDLDLASAGVYLASDCRY